MLPFGKIRTKRMLKAFGRNTSQLDRLDNQFSLGTLTPKSVARKAEGRLLMLASRYRSSVKEIDFLTGNKAAGSDGRSPVFSNTVEE